MHPEQIKAALRMKKFSLVMLAEEMNVSPATVSQVISGRSVSARISGRIVEILGIEYSTVFQQKSSLQRRRSEG